MTLPNEDQPQAPSHRWPLIVVALLAVHVVGMVAVAFVAARDQNFVVIPDHYQQALNWDQQRAAQVRSDALGWKLQFDVDPRVDRNGNRWLRVALDAPAGAPVADAQISIDYFHPAHAAERRTVRLTRADQPGRYSAFLAMPQRGFWEIQAVAVRGADTFLDRQRVWVESDPLPRDAPPLGPAPATPASIRP